MPSESATGDSRKEGWVKRIRSFVTDFLMLCLFVVVLFFATYEMLRDEPVIDVIDVPKELSDKFYTNLAITRRLVDVAAAAQRSYSEAHDPLERPPNFQMRISKSAEDIIGRKPAEITQLKKNKQAYADEVLPKVVNKMPEAGVLKIWDKELDIQLPTVGSLRSIIRFLKTALHVQDVPHITGEITPQSDSKVRLMLRSTDAYAVQPYPIVGSDTEVINKGGEILLELYSPCSAAFYYY